MFPEPQPTQLSVHLHTKNQQHPTKDSYGWWWFPGKSSWIWKSLIKNLLRKMNRILPNIPRHFLQCLLHRLSTYHRGVGDSSSYPWKALALRICAASSPPTMKQHEDAECGYKRKRHIPENRKMNIQSLEWRGGRGYSSDYGVYVTWALFGLCLVGAITSMEPQFVSPKVLMMG